MGAPTKQGQLIGRGVVSEIFWKESLSNVKNYDGDGNENVTKQ